MSAELVTLENGVPVVSSRDVARRFGKEHRHVVEAVRGIISEKSELTSMFRETTYTAGTGRAYPMYLMDRDGFTLLAMGFTGKEALEWKVRYIQAFNKMEERLKAEELKAAFGPKQDARLIEAQARLMNSRNDTAKLLLKIAENAVLHYEREKIVSCAFATLVGAQIKEDDKRFHGAIYLKE